MASRSRVAAARASGVACGLCAGAMRPRTSAYAAMTRLRSAASQNHAAPPATRTRRSPTARATSVRREGTITGVIAREDPSGTAVRTRDTGASPARPAARCVRSADSVDNYASPSRDRARPQAPRRPPAVGPRQHASRGSRAVKAGAPSGQLHEDRAALDADGIAADLDRGVVDIGAGRDVPAPGVPGAGHDAPVELALTERPAAMSAGVVDRVVGPLHVEEGQRLALDLDDPPLACRHVTDGGDLHPSRLSHHSRSLQAVAFTRSPRGGRCGCPCT